MLSFWRAIFYSPVLDPIFKTVASALNVSKQVCKEYCTSGVMMYGLQIAVIVLLVLAAIFVIRLLGLLNLGNMSKEPLNNRLCPVPTQCISRYLHLVKVI